MALSDGAFRLWVCGLVFCQANLTDGFIPAHAVPSFPVRAKNKAALIVELTQSCMGKQPLWKAIDGGFAMNDFLDWNDSRDEVLKQRAKVKTRVDRFRERLADKTSDQSNAVCNALQSEAGTRYERRSLPASTTTTTEIPDQEPRAGRALQFLQLEFLQLDEVRSHLRAALHAELDRDPGISDGDLAERLKRAGASMHVVDLYGGHVTALIESVRGERARRSA